MSAVVPTLSLDGYIDNNDLKMLKIFEHFMASDEAQSTIFSGYVQSLKYILDQNINETDIKSAIELSLATLYDNYFASSDVTVDITDDVNDSSVMDIAISIIVTDDFGNEYTLERALHNIDSNVYTFDTQLEQIKKDI